MICNMLGTIQLYQFQDLMVMLINDLTTSTKQPTVSSYIFVGIDSSYSRPTRKRTISHVKEWSFQVLKRNGFWRQTTNKTGEKKLKKKKIPMLKLASQDVFVVGKGYSSCVFLGEVQKSSVMIKLLEWGF